jgi:DNA gyrase subunit A
MTTEDTPRKNIEIVKIEDEMQGSYLEYAMSVIAGRALPDVRDGLKPVHRRILFAMNELGNTYEKRYLKSARIVGDVIGKYHPHGDSAVYNAMVRMAQEFSLRYPLVDGQGNFGSVDGDSAAAMRYTESRMSRAGGEMLKDIDKNTVEFGPNYDGSMQEPKVLPARIPNLLINGSGGIAVGMSTNIPPHNVGEILRACIAIIDNPDLSFEDLMAIVPGPDLPTAGIITNLNGVKAAYRYGRGSFTIKGRAEVESIGKDKEALIITELPYQVNKANWIENIANLVRNKDIEGITDLRDESDRKGMRVVIELRKGEQSNVVLNHLYAKTQLKISFGVIMLAIQQGRPKLFNLKEALQAFNEHRREVVTKRTVFELQKAEARAHILEGLRKALDQIDAVVEVIKKAAGPVEAKMGLQESFGLSAIQAQAILEMRLQRLTALETQKLIDELAEVKKEIEAYKLILSSDAELFKVIKGEYNELLERYGDKRRSEIVAGEESEMTDEAFVRDEQAIVTITNAGYAKRCSSDTYRAQGRGGKGIKGAGTGDEDFVTDIFVASTLSYILCFTNMGKVHWLKVHQIPEMSRTARGRPIVQMLQFEKDERVLSLLPVANFEDGKFVVMATKKGVIKKTELMAFSNVRTAGIIALSIDEGDELIGATLTTGQDSVFMATKLGQSIRFPEDDVRAMGRSARGVRGIDIDASDEVVAMEILPGTEAGDAAAGYTLLSVTSRGYGKRTPLNEYRAQGRGGSGIINVKTGDKIGELVAVKKVRPGDDLIVISSGGQLIRTPSDSVSEMGRNTQGVRVMNMDEGETVKALAVVREVDEVDATGSETVH